MTAALDGESSLKRVKALCTFGRDFRAKIKRKGYYFSVEEPVKDIYHFGGFLECDHEIDGSKAKRIEELKIDHFVPRGSVLQHSGHIYCMVVYVGAETKLMMNLGQFKIKQSMMKRRLNFVLFFNFILFLVSIFACCVYNRVKNDELYHKHWYIFDSIEETVNELLHKNFFALWMLCNYLVPIDVLFVQ